MRTCALDTYIERRGKEVLKVESVVDSPLPAKLMWYAEYSVNHDIQDVVNTDFVRDGLL